MKRLTPLLLSAVLLSACSYIPYFSQPGEQAAAPLKRRASAPGPSDTVMVDGVAVQKVAFRAGVSSATVERLGKAEQCFGGRGAGLVTEPGPVEVYRMACDNGKVFLARCEFRQCVPLRSTVASR